MSVSERIRGWIGIQELYKHPTVLFPFLLGTAIAWSEAGMIDWQVFVVSIIGTYFLTNMAFISNEYFDYETDKANVERVGGIDNVGITTTGGTRVLVRGLLPRKHALIASIVFGIAAIPLWALLHFHLNSRILLPLVVLWALIGWFYTSPPIKASYRGFGELFMAIGFTIPVFVGYYIYRGFSLLPLIVALPWTIDVPALKIIREFPDYEADKSVNRRNLVVIFGRDKMAPIFITLTIISLITFIPIILIVRDITLLVLLLPIFFLLSGLIPMLRGEWKEKDGLENICKNSFIAMLLIPVALAIIFVLQGLI